MGDYIFTYDQSGHRYYDRLYWAIVIFMIIGFFSLMTVQVNLVISFLIGLVGVIVLISYVVFFIHENPPKEYSEEETDSGP